MKETIFEQVASAASVLKLDLSAEEFALFAEDREFSEAGMEAVQMKNALTTAAMQNGDWTSNQPLMRAFSPVRWNGRESSLTAAR